MSSVLQACDNGCVIAVYKIQCLVRTRGLVTSTLA